MKSWPFCISCGCRWLVGHPIVLCAVSRTTTLQHVPGVTFHLSGTPSRISPDEVELSVLITLLLPWNSSVSPLITVTKSY